MRSQVSYNIRWFAFVIREGRTRGDNGTQTACAHGGGKGSFASYPISMTDCYIKGTGAWDFCPLVLFSNRPRLAPCLLYYIFFEFCIEFAELFEFEIRTAQWATAENQTFLANTRDLKLGWCRPSVLLFIYIHFFGITVPLKDMASF